MCGARAAAHHAQALVAAAEFYTVRNSVDDRPADTIEPPSMLLFALEGQRALLEAVSLVPASPLLRSAPQGDGHPVLVLPGFGAGDESTVALRFYLRRLGYWVQGWRLGRNMGLQSRRGHFVHGVTQ